jgi:hypothetical protein
MSHMKQSIKHVNAARDAFEKSLTGGEPESDDEETP